MSVTDAIAIKSLDNKNFTPCGGGSLLSASPRADEQQHQSYTEDNQPQHHSRHILGKRNAPCSNVVLGALPPRLKREDDGHHNTRYSGLCPAERVLGCADFGL
ncbi:hypothetical protein [Microbacterium sp.]|uniref:hypothetical protein n=1 Tax=Microbacterium sp. TaxID=51671 RepID=UPI0028A08218|nr:hypothetical protein [Microbacterium sp.]